MLDICRVLYLICLKTKALCPKRFEKKQKEKREAFFFFHLLLNDKKGLVNAASVITDDLLGLAKVSARVRSMCFWSHVTTWVIPWLWEGLSFWTGRVYFLVRALFVCGLKKKNNTKTYKKKAKRVLIPRPIRWSWCWPPLASWFICLQ